MRLSVTRSRHVVEPDVSIAEARAWWSAVRPPAVTIHAVDPTHDELDDLATIGREDQGGQATSRFGGKAANLARLYAFLPPDNQVPGFAVPFRYYADFLSGNRMEVDGASPRAERTYAEHIAMLHDDAEFRSNAGVRSSQLERLRDTMRDEGHVPEAAVQSLAARIDDVFGEGTMVRFRSSSNAEDGLVFNGAGLYDSTSVCVADSFDADEVGPSRCDPAQAKERTIERGLKKVWASVWNARAWEEREYFGIDHLLTGMAVLVTPAFPDERANGVAFTGDPNRPASDEYIVSVQDGDASVVHAGGVLPERSAITISDGRVTGVRRLQSSSLMPPGQWVMSEQELRELGSLMAIADARFPVEVGEHDRDDVLLDIEFKIRRGEDRLLIKQIRPFLTRVPDVSGQPVAARVHAPGPMTVCATWREGHGLRRELEEQAVLALNESDLELPQDSGAVTHTLFGSLAFGRDLAASQALGFGQARFEAEPGDGTDRRLVLTRRYSGDSIQIDVELALTGMNEGEFDLRVLDGSSLTWRAFVTAAVRDGSSGDVITRLRFAPCAYEELPLYRHEVELEGGGRLTLMQRLERDDGVTGQAALVEAEVELAGGRQLVGDYGRLVYAADRHHWNEQFLVLLDPPIGDAHGVAFYRDHAGAGEPTYRAEVLDSEIERLRVLGVGSVARTRQ